MALPQNWQTIVSYLESHGYTAPAAAGIAGNIEQESGGDPESAGSGGGGLIGFTPLPSGYVTGNPSRDLQTQLQAVLQYNNGIGAGAINQLNKFRNPQLAAQYYMTTFEKPNPAVENAANREQSAKDVFTAMGNAGISPATASAAAGQTQTAGLTSGLNPLQWVMTQLGISSASDMIERLGLILLGTVLVLVGLIKFTGAGKQIVKVAGLSSPSSSEGSRGGKTEEEKLDEWREKQAGDLPEENEIETKGFERGQRKRAKVSVKTSMDDEPPF